MLIASITLDLISLLFVTTSGLVTTLNVACKLVSAYGPINGLYFTGL